MRGFKQAIYAFFYIILWSGVFAGIYFWYVRPSTASCSNGKKDYNEAGIDCGGICARVCMPDLKPLQVAAVALMPLNGNSTDASILLEIRNPNPDYAASADLEINLLGLDGAKLGAESRTVQLAPGDVLFVGMPSVHATSSIAKAEARVVATNWSASSTLRKLDLSVNILAVSEKSGNIEVTGTLVNNDSAIAGSAELLARFYDSEGDLVGISETSLDQVLPRESRAFSILHPKIPGLAPERTSIVPAAYITQ